MATIRVTVHRSAGGDYWSDVEGDIDALVAVEVVYHDDDGPEVMYRNDAAIDLAEAASLEEA